MENLNSPKLNTQIDLSISNSHLNENELVRKETTLAQSKGESFFKTFLKENLDTFDTPSTKALIKIVLSRHILLKIFFFLFVVITNGLASYLVIESIMNYLAYDVTTKSRTIYETPTLFPKVTICNLNMYQTEYAYDFLQYTEYQDPSFLSIEERKKFGHDLNDILIECSFNGYTCSSSDFTWSLDLRYGNCWTFNSGFNQNGSQVNLKESIISGPSYGLYLQLYVNVYEMLLNSDNSNIMNSLGAVIRIGNSSYETFYSYGEGIFLSPGFETNIIIDREFRSVLPKPYSNCEIDSNSPQFIEGLDLYNQISQSGYKYTQQVCFLECYQKYVFNKYNCTNFFFPSIFMFRKCSLIFSFENISEHFDQYFIKKHCLSACPLECDQSLYKSSSSFSQLIRKDYTVSTNILSDFLNRTFDEKSLVQAHIFYQSLSYTLTTESPQWDAISLFGSIGGNLGLFLGMSVFSLCELVEVAVEIFFNIKQRKVRSPA